MSNPSLVMRSFVIATALAMVGPTMARAADAPAAASTGKQAEATGEAAIVNGDEATAKKKAKQAAIRNAIENTLGSYVASTSESKDFQLVSDKVMSSVDGYVTDVKEVESKKEGETWVVKITCIVDKGHIDQDMKAVKLTIESLKFPRLAVLIAEQGINETAPSMAVGPQGGGKQGGNIYTTDERVVENKLMEAWLEDGFTFVDMNALAGKVTAATVVNANPGSGELRSISNLTDADVIIMGTAMAKNQGNLGELLGGGEKTPMTSCKGLISLKVFNTDGGEILASATGDKTTMHIDPLVCGHNALIQASKVVADDLKKKLLKSWNNRVNNGSRIRLVVSSVPSLKVLNDFKNALKEVRGVQSVDQKSFGGGKADIDLKVEGGAADDVAADIDGKTYGKAKVTVSGYTSNTITVSLGQ